METLKSSEISLPVAQRQLDRIANHDSIMAKYEAEKKVWAEKAALLKAQGKKAPSAPRRPFTKDHPHAAAVLYNGMVAPVIPYAIKGAIWYQGESNVGHAWQYDTIFPMMIQDWRNRWGCGDFPFYFVQIAPYSRYGGDRDRGLGGSETAELRQTQLNAMLNIPNTGMVVVSDITPDLNNIHPTNKHDVGKRLALWALNKNYMKWDIVPSGPIYKSMSIDGDKIKLQFDYVGGPVEAVAGGLEVRGNELRGFTIAADDQKFVPAKAKIEGNSVVVWADGVDNPVAVRYCWSKNAVQNLFNKAGLPASPFRTDDWPMVTEGRK